MPTSMPGPTVRENPNFGCSNVDFLSINLKKYGDIINYHYEKIWIMEKKL